MANTDFTMAPVVNQEKSSTVKSPNFSIKLRLPGTSALEQNEATNPRNEDVQNIEGSRVGQQEDVEIPTIAALYHFLNLSSKPKFTLFPKLPAEIRLMIWKAALPGPRLVDVNFQFEDSEFAFGSNLASCASPTPPPTLLSVCHESRTEALKHYSLCFAVGSEEVGVFCDLKIDTLFISCCYPVDDILSCLNLSGSLAGPAFQGLQHLAVGLHPGMRYVDPVDHLFLMEQLRGLETFTFVLHDKHNCGTEWHDRDIREVASEKEPNGYRAKFAQVMEDQSLWVPGRWRKAPALKFMRVNEE